MAIAIPMPPPIQSDATPFFPPIRLSTCMRVTRTLHPDAPIGWPKAIAPPCIFTLLGSIFNSRTTANAWAANASFNSYASTSSLVQFAFLSYNQNLVLHK